MSSLLLGLNLSQVGHSLLYSHPTLYFAVTGLSKKKKKINLPDVIRVLVTLEGISTSGWCKKKNAEVLNQFAQGHLKLCPVKASQHNLSVFPGKFYYEYLVGDVNTEMSSFLVKKLLIFSYLGFI